MKYAEAKKIVKELGMKLSLNRDYNEYRVALPGANAESSAYYTPANSRGVYRRQTSAGLF